MSEAKSQEMILLKVARFPAVCERKLNGINILDSSTSLYEREGDARPLKIKES